MSSASKTTNYGLNQWAGNEYPKRQDFVDDNAAIDAAIKARATDLTVHTSNADLHTTQAEKDANSNHIKDKNNPHGITPAQIGAITRGIGWWDANTNIGISTPIVLEKPVQATIGTDTVIRTLFNNSTGDVVLQFVNSANDKGVFVRLNGAADWACTEIMTSKNISTAHVATADTASNTIPITTPALRNTTMSNVAPSGGQNGDVWHQYK